MRSVGAILRETVKGERLSEADALRVVKEANFIDLAKAAHAMREQRTDPRIATYVVDRNINYTNVCNVYCTFCAFYRGPNEKDAYTLTVDEVLEKIQPLVDQGGTQVLLQGGLNPDVPITYLEDLFRAIRRRFPTVDVHSLTATEIEFYAKELGVTYRDVLKRLKRAGLRSIPGGGMEILVDEVRERVSPLKTSASVYLEVHKEAHNLGMTTTGTQMFGMGETWAHRIEHLRKLRDLQEETGGFTAFIPWTFQTDGSTQLKAPPVTADEYLRVIALSRLFLDNFDHVQAGWVTEGAKVAQVALRSGADDWGGVLMEENVISAAGTLFGMTPGMARRWIRDAGFVPAQRNTYYNTLDVYEDPTPEETPEAPKLNVHLGHVGNRGRPIKLGQSKATVAERPNL